jgi:hypothetical protein
MKQIQLLFTVLALSYLLSGCKKSNEEVQPVSVTFQVKFDEQTSGLGLSPANTEVTITNQVNGQINKAVADQHGVVNFSSIIPGKYTVVSTLKIKATDYTAASGVLTIEDVVFNANLNAALNQQSGTINMELKAGRLGDWVIKQIYYGGSSTTDGAVFRDQFFEIYNNSSEVMYADSLYFGLIIGVNNTKSDLTKPYFLQTGQFDWTKSINMNNVKANTDYVYAKSIYRIPGTGKQYPVQPGNSIIIAQNAMNHKVSFTSGGKQYTVKNPDLTIDLSHADFEAYFGNLPGINPLATDLDNASVPNIDVIYLDDRDLILDSRGQEAIVIFKTKEDVKTFAKYPSPDIAAITISTEMFVQLPNSLIIDAVELAQTVATKRVPHRLPASLDGGFTFVPGGSYSSQSVIRKTSKIVNGRRILKDSNNSSEDFDFLPMSDPTKTIFK